MSKVISQKVASPHIVTLAEANALVRVCYVCVKYPPAGAVGQANKQAVSAVTSGVRYNGCEPLDLH